MGTRQERMGTLVGQGQDSADWGQESGVNVERNGFWFIL